MYQMRKRYLLPPTGFKLWKHPCLTEEFHLNSKGKPFYFCPTMQGCYALDSEGRREETFKFWAPLDLMTTVNLSELWGIAEEPGMLQSMRSQRIGHDLTTEQQQQIYFSTKISFV